MPKHLIVCCDGTWNTVDQDRPSNVVKMSRALATTRPDGTHQVVYYSQGVGTRGFIDRIRGGIFGHGLDRNIEDAYLFLLNNYQDGDSIYLFGFSRGAYTARSLGGLLRNCGLLKKEHAGQFRAALDMYRRRDAHPDSSEAKQFRASYSSEVTVRFLGVWDTVGSLGIPLRRLQFLTRRRYLFHDVELSGMVQNAYQALGIDERRGSFQPSLWANKPKPNQHIEQVWFTGVHADIGGGYPDAGLSAITFLWMKAKAQSCGLVFDEDYITKAFRPNPTGTLHNSMTLVYRLTCPYDRVIGAKNGAAQSVHPVVIERYEAMEDYRPKNLVAYLEQPDHQVSSI